MIVVKPIIQYPIKYKWWLRQMNLMIILKRHNVILLNIIFKNKDTLCFFSAKIVASFLAKDWR